MIEFADFYEAIHGPGYRPFMWQEHVAKHIISHGWPEQDILDPPTAAGKTSMIDIAVYALAAQCDRPALERTAPLRTFFVIDRRLVVDDVTRHAIKVRNAIETDVLVDIRERLRRFGGSQALEVKTLRGGMYRDDSWADTPNQPLICVSTVDQVGSRLLFRGYGVSERRRPIDAGLLGCDSLFILDEAHLSQPFLGTLKWVRKYAGWAEQLPAPPPRVLELTATPLAASGFQLPGNIYAGDSRLSSRLTAIKPADLLETGDIIADVSRAARLVVRRPGVRVVGIVVNRVDTARAIFEELRGDSDKAVLLTGRIRPADRDRLMDEYRDLMRAGRTRSEESLFVVATQTVEVGADLDFDALLTEAAPLDALRQRFGRLNRLGNGPPSVALIFKRRRKKGEEESVYGASLDRTWEWLNQHAEAKGGHKTIDFGALRMKALYQSQGDASLNSEVENGPSILPSHLEAWVQTYPTPEPDPDVAPFLHGPQRGAADVNIVWRTDLPAILEDWPDVIEAAPPVSIEALPVPLWAAKKWLAAESASEISDLEVGTEPLEAALEPTRIHWIWRGPGNRLGAQIGPGDTIVVRSSEGGSDRFGWSPECTDPVKDIGDECANERARRGGGRFRVRLHPDLFAPGDEERTAELMEQLAALREGDDATRTSLIRDVAERFAETMESDWRLEAYGAGPAFRARSRWIKAPPKKAQEQLSAAPSGEDSNDDDSASLSVDISLEEHVGDVVKKVELFVAGCGLEKTLRQAIETAASLHDLGKWDERFQDMLDPRRDLGAKPLAKGNGGDSEGERERRQQYAAYPQGARHEFWSLALVEEAGRLDSDAERDLVAYLVGTHHGYGRPLAPYWADAASVTADIDGRTVTATNVMRFAVFGSGWVDRFWALNRRYGYWGLAYLETMLRRADCVASREEEQRRGED